MTDDAERDWVGDFLEKLASDTCPHCDTDVKRHRQVGRCVYAEPCGHRLYQGKAREVDGREPNIVQRATDGAPE